MKATLHAFAPVPGTPAPPEDRLTFFAFVFFLLTIVLGIGAMGVALLTM